MVSKPSAPDPVATANAQAGLNQSTATTQQLLNQTNQVNPYGSVMYNQTGNNTFTDSSGKVTTVPQFTQTTTLSPTQQGIFDKTQAAQTNLAGLAEDQSAAMRDYLNKPFTFDNQDAADWSYDLASSRILPQQQKAQAATEAQLINSGLRPGTQAWNSEMQRLTNANTDQLNQLALTGRGQAFNEALTARNQPINELSALLSSSQITNPGTASSATPQTSVGGVDYTGLVNQQYQSKLAGSQGALGGLFGLAGSLGSAAITASDRRVKDDIRVIGKLDNGLPVYSFRYKSGGPVQIGLMAQDVQEVNPAAVVDVGGVLHVDYGQATA